MKENLMEKMKNLVDELNVHAHNYYVLDNPTISDFEYDKLYDELLSLEKQMGVVLPNSPSIRVGGETLKGFSKFEHKMPLYSLNKCNNFKELEKFVSDVKTEFADAEFTVEYKFDGLTLVVEYQNGLFVRAGTRGNGFVGEDVTEQVKTIHSVPLSIKYKGHLIVQGEGLITLSNLDKYNKTAKEPLKNARNAVAGAIRNLDPKVTASRNLDMFAYAVVFKDGTPFKTQQESMEFLKHNGFKVSNFFHVSSSASHIEDIISEVDKTKKNLDILMDGIVIKTNQIKYRDEIGYTSKFPKWAIAYKFEAQEISTMLNDVIWQVGRTGKITPIAQVEPVKLAGALIQRATLNNVGDIQRKCVKIGSRVFLRRSNEVIPEILGLAEDYQNSREIEIPTHCPCCNTKLVEIGANLFCTNNNCPEKVVDYITHFASRDAMNIEGFSEKTSKLLYDKYGLNKASKLYEINMEDLLSLDGFKYKKAENLMQSIEQSKVVNLSNFIFALGINGVGKKTAQDLAKHFKSLKSLMGAAVEELISIRDVGDVVGKSIYEYFNNSENVEEISRLFEAGIKIKEIEKEENSIFSGKTVVLTGSLEKYTRSEATALLEKNGANVASSVSKNTDYVLAGANAGSKLAKAEVLGVKIISEKDLEQMLKII